MTLKTISVSSFYEDWADGLPGKRHFKPFGECYQCNGKPGEDGKMYGYILWQHQRMLDGHGKYIYHGSSMPANVLWFDTVECRALWIDNRGDKKKTEIAVKVDDETP